MSTQAAESRFWLVRHAPVDGPNGVIHGDDAPANITGVRAIDELRSQLPPHAAVFASPMRRTLETARALGFVNPVLEPALREQDFGAWTGCRHDDLEKAFGSAYADFWRAPATTATPGGESFADQITRVREWITLVPSGDFIVVTHSGTVRAALAFALGLAPQGALRFTIDPLSLTRIDRIENNWRVVFVNRGAGPTTG